MSLALVVPALIAGFAGSAHCAGMCGPIVGMFEAAPAGGQSALRRRAGYHVGRLVFYALLGAVVGLLGTALATSMPARTAAMTLRLLAALALLLVGIRLWLGNGRRTPLDRAGQALWRHLSPLARYVLPMHNLPRALGAGFIWGAVPCGLVYSVLALAAASGSAPAGAAVMFAFWAGTLPALSAVGASARGAFNSRYRRLAGAALVIFASVSLALLWQSFPAGGHEAMGMPQTMSHGGHAM